MFKRIVVGTDGSPTAQEAVAAATELATLAGGTLHIVSGYQPKSGLHVSGAGARTEDWAISSSFEVEGVLRDAAEVARRAKIEVQTHHESGDPAKALVAVATREEADLVVVGNKGMKGVKRLIFGSVPNEVAHNAPCAVLILKTT